VLYPFTLVVHVWTKDNYTYNNQTTSSTEFQVLQKEKRTGMNKSKAALTCFTCGK
jgi:hypothetical protein